MNRLRADQNLRVSDFDYDLPPELIAQTPLAERDASRLLVVDRAGATFHHSRVADLACWLRAGDLLVANNSRVLPARLRATKLETGGRVELLLLAERRPGRWTALAKPARRLRLGARLRIEGHHPGQMTPLHVVLVGMGEDGSVELQFPDGTPRLEDYGEAPLPPYIGTKLSDAERYQTVYGSRPGSAAAPTAGLHFTDALIQDLRDKGIGWAEVTLHVGLDTFRPVTADLVADHRIHREWCSVPHETAAAIAATRAAGGRIVAVGTTAARTLETLGAEWDEGRPRGLTKRTELFIVPGYRWRVVDVLLTNFHLPRSTLLMMVSALAGRETIMRAYQEAIRERYRFFSFGDAMLIR